MFAAMLLAISIVALSQFALYYWRAILTGVAAQPVSDRVLSAAHVESGCLTGQDFETLAGLHELTPNLDRKARGLGFVQGYYRVLAGLAFLAEKHMPALAAWCERERVLCARFAAVQIEQRLQTNLALAAAMRAS